MYALKPTLAAVGAVLLSSLSSAAADSLYTKNSGVLQVDTKNYDTKIAQSPYTSIVEFYAPWCGHCQNLKPAYEKAAKSLKGLAVAAAVNCDEDTNKPLCSQMGVKGFPTLKIVKPGKTSGRPVVEDYQGPRTAKGIVEAVIEKIPNHVKRVTDKDINDFLTNKNDTAKAILFTEKGITSPLLKSIAIDFLNVISIAQIRNKESKAVEMFGIQSFPALVLLPGGEQPGQLHDGELKKEAMVKFLSQAGKPYAATESKKEKEKKPKKDKAKDKQADAKDDTEKSDEPASQEDDDTATPSPPPKAVVNPPIPAITETDELTSACLNRKAGTCILAFVPATHGETAEKALSSLSEIASKHSHGQRHLFPFYEVHTETEGVASLSKSLELSGDVHVIAVNGKRGWWRQYEGDFDRVSVESWIDAIRLSEGIKQTLPEGIISQTEEKPVEEKPTEEQPQDQESADQKPLVEKVEEVDVKVEEEVKIDIETEPETNKPASFQGAEPTPEYTQAQEKPVEAPVEDAKTDHDEL